MTAFPTGKATTVLVLPTRKQNWESRRADLPDFTKVNFRALTSAGTIPRGPKGPRTVFPGFFKFPERR